MLPQVENIILYIDDAVRYDLAADRLGTLGQTYRSVAASVHTPASFGSIFTGLHVPNHGVTGFDSKLSTTTRSIFDLNDDVAKLSARGGLNDSIATMYPSAEQCSLDELNPPFVWVIRAPGGHAPYNGYDMSTFEFEQETAREYLLRVAGDESRIRRDYEQGVHSSIDNFQRILGSIEERGLSESTLAIYTSDHGELLGENGLLGHNHLACPELVYVPTTFVHPDIEPGQNNQLIRNVDLLPTIQTVLDHQSGTWDVDGKPIGALDENPVAYNHYEQRLYSFPVVEPDRTVFGLWDADGGHVMVESSRRAAMMTYIGILLRSHCGRQIFANKAFVSSAKQFVPGWKKYGSPTFNKSAAQRICEKIQSEAPKLEDSGAELEVDEQQLEDLGYI